MHVGLRPKAPEGRWWDKAKQWQWLWQACPCTASRLPAVDRSGFGFLGFPVLCLCPAVALSSSLMEAEAAQQGPIPVAHSG